MPTLDRPISWSRTSQALAKPRHLSLLPSKSQVRPLLGVSKTDRPRSSQKIETRDVLSSILMLVGFSLVTVLLLGFLGTQAILGTGSYSIIEMLRGLCL